VFIPAPWYDGESKKVQHFSTLAAVLALTMILMVACDPAFTAIFINETDAPITIHFGPGYDHEKPVPRPPERAPTGPIRLGPRESKEHTMGFRDSTKLRVEADTDEGTNIFCDVYTVTSANRRSVDVRIRPGHLACRGTST
jgi:hypothetical protein